MLKFLKNLVSSKKDCEEKKRPTTLRLAVEKGYINEKQACAYEDEMSGDVDFDETHTDLMIDRDLITESQANVLAFDMKKEDPEQALADRFKKASRAMEQNKETAEAVGNQTQGIRLAAVQAAKNQG